MVVAKSLQETIIEQLKTNELVSIPASEEDYLSIASALPFKVEYHANEIITMGLASYLHEKLVITLGSILYNLLFEKDDFDILGSNSGVSIPKFEGPEHSTTGSAHRTTSPEDNITASKLKYSFKTREDLDQIFQT